MTDRTARWVTDDSAAMLTDLYELTMLQSYLDEGMRDGAVFSLFCRRLPRTRNYLLACGLDDALHFLETARFTPAALEYLRGLRLFGEELLSWLSGFRFTGDVYAVPEGMPIFANEPILEIVAPLPEAQLAETFVLNQVHFQTVVASKAARVVGAARGRPVVDFGLRRMHAADAGLKSVRAFHIAGVDATSNVLASQVYGVPARGTMAHSYVQAHDRELDAFRAFAARYPETILLVDTYDTARGVDHVIDLARELGPAFRVRGVRLDSGDLAALAVDARRRLDAAGLQGVQIFASGGLNEYEIADLLERGAPIDAFGVGTDMGVSADAPALDVAYKLAEYAGRGRLKTSPGKAILPGRKQIFRLERDGVAVGDTVGRATEACPGRPLLQPVMLGGKRTAAGRDTLDRCRSRAREEIGRLPPAVRGLDRAEPAYEVKISSELERYRDSVRAEVEARETFIP